MIRGGVRLGLALRASLLSFAALAGLSITVEIAVVRPMTSREDPRLTAQADGFAALVRREGPAGFRRQAAGWVKPGRGEWAALVGAKGAVLAEEGRVGVPDLLAVPEGEPGIADSFAPWGDRVVARAASAPDGTPYRVVAGVSLRDVRTDQTGLRLVLGIVTLAGVILVGLGAWAGAGAVLRPLSRLTGAAREAAAAPAERRLEVPPDGGEFEELGRLLDDLLVRLQALLEEERRFASDAAHELQGPLSVLRVRAERALSAGDPAGMREALEACTAEVDRLSRLVQALLELSRVPGPAGGRPSGGGGDCDAGAVLGSMVPDLEVLGSARGVVLRAEPLPGGPSRVAAAPEVVETCVSILVDNAIRYSPAPGTVHLRALREGDRVRIEVRDGGPGVPVAEKDRIFDRLFRGEAARLSSARGFGLGLSLARRLARSAGGDIRLLNPGEPGACFAVELPLAPGPAGA